MRCWLQMRELTDELRPVAAYRTPGHVLLAVDPRSTRRGILTWLADHLTPVEINALRAAYDLGEPGTSMPDWTSEEAPAMLFVPIGIRVPGSAALQGGRELERRRVARQLSSEASAYAAEIAGGYAWTGMLATSGGGASR